MIVRTALWHVHCVFGHSGEDVVLYVLIQLGFSHLLGLRENCSYFSVLSTTVCQSAFIFHIESKWKTLLQLLLFCIYKLLRVAVISLFDHCCFTVILVFYPFFIAAITHHQHTLFSPIFNEHPTELSRFYQWEQTVPYSPHNESVNDFTSCAYYCSIHQTINNQIIWA